MKWESVREHYPSQWVLVEAIAAHSEPGKRIVEEMTVVNAFPDSTTAMQSYKQLHRQLPERELMVLHTDREVLDIQERHWLGIRGVA